MSYNHSQGSALPYLFTLDDVKLNMTIFLHYFLLRIGVHANGGEKKNSNPIKREEEEERKKGGSFSLCMWKGCPCRYG